MASAMPVGTGAGTRRSPARWAGGPDRGAVAVEASVTLLGLALVLAALVWFLAVVGAQLRAADAARSGAVLAARAQPYADVRDDVHRIAPGADVSVSRSGDRVVVVVRQRLAPPLGPFSGIGAFEVSGRASAALEQP